MYSSKVAILVGAGASLPAGIPAMRGLAQSFRQSLDDSSTAYQDYRFLRSLGVSEDVEDILQVAKRIRQYNDSHLESFVERAVSPSGGSQTLDEVKNRQANNLTATARLEETLLDFIRERCFHFKREQAVELYSGLLTVINQAHIPVFTTNYDFVLEHVAETNGYRIVDNFKEDNQGRSFWDPSLESFKGKGVRIVKIHGSVRWYADDTGRIENIPYRAEMNPEGHRLRNLVIFPTRFKDIYDQHYFSLYSVFLRSLDAVELLVVVGHSLRDEYIRAAIRERVMSGDITVVVIDPGEPLLNDIREASTDAGHSASVTQFPWDIEKVAPLVTDALDRRAPADVVSYFRKAEQVLSRKRTRYDQIWLSDPPHWVSPGEELELDVEGEITVGGGELAVWLDVERKKSKRRLLEWKLVNGSDKLFSPVRGMHEFAERLRVILPADLPRTGHRLGVGLLSPQRKREVISREYKVRTRKN